jgi:prepilin-type N-terminal cleavage/methylation domain-containing protein
MRGYTLIELLFVLLLAGLTAAAITPQARRYRDRASVVAAREAMVGLFAEARVGAVERGQGAVRISSNPGRAACVVGDSTVRALALASEFGVDLRLGGSDDSVEVRYDALGLGRVASQTVVFTRGDASAQLVVSSFGRVSRR